MSLSLGGLQPLAPVEPTADHGAAAAGELAVRSREIDSIKWRRLPLVNAIGTVAVAGSAWGPA
jgi:hypothetical protein